MARTGSILGHPVLRREDPPLLRGAARYLDDLRFDGLTHAVFVRSTIAHARLAGVDVSAAAAAPGVLGVFTAADLGLAPLQTFFMIPPALSRPPLADGTVRFVGDAIAVVVADDRARAFDAAEQVVVDYEPLPAVVDLEAALAPDAPQLFPEHGSNVAITFDGGDPAEALAGAEVVVRARFVNQRLAGAPMEPNGALALPDPEIDGIRVYAATQDPHTTQGALVSALGLPPDRVRVIAPVVGGGFGSKARMYPEYLVVAACAQRLGRPVKWVETRSESMLAMHQGRDQLQDVELGLTRDGRITGLAARILQDSGAYPSIGAFLPYLTKQMASGTYEIPRVAVTSVSVMTNKVATAAYRGAGRPEATAMLERVLDVAAAELGLDPVEIRQRNLIAPFTEPHVTATGATYDVGDYRRALDEAIRRAGYGELRAEQRARLDRGDRRVLGIGVSCYVEVTSGGLWKEYGRVEVEPDGSVTATVGTSAHGQGHETAFSMLLSDVLGVPMESVRLVQSDTALVPRGLGTMGSRSLQIGGSALVTAAHEVLTKAKRLAAHLLEASVDDIVLDDDGRLGVAGVPTRALTWAELAVAARDDARRPAGVEPGLAHEHDWDQTEATYPFGAHVAVVEIDLDTGAVTLLRHVAVDDCGRVLNPLLVRGQVEGGIAQGVGQALFEGVEFDDDGNPLTTTLMDYAIPSAAELPRFETYSIETPTFRNPLGAKGVGESGTIGSTPAVHNAVVDALRPFGVRHLDMPLTAPRVWRALRDAAGAAG